MFGWIKNKMKNIFLIITIFSSTFLFSQTDMDGLMMDKNSLCAGATTSTSTWKNYWEGTLKRENLNLGKVTTNTVAINGNYGITNKLNAIFSVPYITTKASAGQLKGQKGLQDLSLFIKWVGVNKKLKSGVLNGIIIGGISLPLTNYTPDLLPLSIGMHCKTASVRAMLDYEKKHWFATASSTYIVRGNVKLDRETYYTTTLHYTNMVEMPNIFTTNLRIGYRTNTKIFEAYFNKYNCLNGFDITRNNMPFVSNKMEASLIGIHLKYYPNFIKGLSVDVDGATTLTGRNVGQNTNLSVGIFYLINFNKKKWQ